MLLDKIYAGLDKDGQAKLFLSTKNNNPKNIIHEDWLMVLSELKVKAGYLVKCQLSPFVEMISQNESQW